MKILSIIFCIAALSLAGCGVMNAPIPPKDHPKTEAS